MCNEKKCVAHCFVWQILHVLMQKMLSRAFAHAKDAFLTRLCIPGCSICSLESISTPENPHYGVGPMNLFSIISSYMFP